MTLTDLTDDLAFDLFARWEDEKAKGHHVSLEEVCAEHPEALPHVREIARRLSSVAELFPTETWDPGQPPSGGSPAPPAGHPAGWVEVGRGASSVVYRGHDPTFGTAVAYKVLHTHGRLFTADDIGRLMKRFEQEARILARLKHDGIVRIFKTFSLGGRPVLEMEYLPGSLATHADAIRRRGAAAVGRFVERVAAAVGFAHAHDIVHRDLKPSNILLDAGGRPCVTDFGVAKLLDPSEPVGPPVAPVADPGGDTEPETACLTALGRQPGTKAYMAPEQFDPARGPISPATDVWAIGVILYELVNGARPFAGGTADEWRRAVCDGPPPARRCGLWRAERRLESIALRCLARDPAKRFASASEVAAAVNAAIRPRPRRRVIASAVAVCVAAIAFAALNAPAPKPPQPPPTNQDAEARAAVERDALAAFRQCADGNVSKGLFAFAKLLNHVPADAQDLRTAIRANIAGWADSLATVDGLYTHPERVTAVAASRDGRWVAVGDDRGGLVIWDAHAARVHKRWAGHTKEVKAAAFSSDGRWLVTGSMDCTARIWSVERPDTAAANELFIGEWVFAVALTPDGEYVVTGTAYEKHAGVNFWNLKSGKRVGTPPTKRQVKAFAVDARGGRLLALNLDNETELWDLKRRHLLGPLADGKGTNTRSAAFSADGRTIATGGDSLLFWDADTRELKSEESREATEVFGFAPCGAVVVQTGGAVRLWQPEANCFDPLPTPRPTAPEIRVVSNTHLIGVEDKRVVVPLRWPAAAVRSLPLPRTCLAMHVVSSDDGMCVAARITPDSDIGRGKPGQRHAGIQVWDMRNNRAAGPPIRTPGLSATVAELTADGRHLALQLGVNPDRPLDPRPVHVFEVASGGQIGTFSGHLGDVFCMKHLVSRSAWVTAGEDGWLKVWTPEGAIEHATRFPDEVRRLHVDPGERSLAVACKDGSVAYLDLSPNAVEEKWRRPSGAKVDKLVISPDGSTVAALGRDRRLRAWAAADGTPVPVPDALHDLKDVLPNPGGEGWVTIHLSGAVRWWPALTADKPRREWQLAAGLSCVGLDPTGTELVTTTADGQAQAWSVRTRLPVGPPVRHRLPVHHTAWGGGRLLSVSEKSARVWSPATAAALPDEKHLTPWLSAVTGTTPDGPLADTRWLELRPVVRTGREMK